MLYSRPNCRPAERTAAQPATKARIHMSHINPNDIPMDENGDVLRNMLNDGADLSQPHIVDFYIAVPNQKVGTLVAAAAAKLGFDTDLTEDEPGSDWTVCCSKQMVPDHAAITQIEQDLDQLATPLGGRIDGWGALSL